MDNKITKARLKNFFTYDFLKVLAIAAALSIFMVVLCNLFAVKPTGGQRLLILYGDDIEVEEGGANLFVQPFMQDAEYKYSYEVLEAADKYLNKGEQTSQYMLKTWHDVGDDDIFICTDSLTNADRPDSSLYRYYVTQQFAQDLKVFVNNALDYTKPFFDENGNPNITAIKEHFDLTRGKDNRFRTKSQKEEGLIAETERLKSIYDNANILKDVFEKHPEILKYDEYDFGSFHKTGHFAIRLRALTGAQNRAIDDFKGKELTEVNGNKVFVGEVYLMIGFHEEINGDNHFETLTYLVTFIKKYSNFIG